MEDLAGWTKQSDGWYKKNGTYFNTFFDVDVYITKTSGKNYNITVGGVYQDTVDSLLVAKKKGRGMSKAHAPPEAQKTKDEVIEEYASNKIPWPGVVGIGPSKDLSEALKKATAHLNALLKVAAESEDVIAVIDVDPEDAFLECSIFLKT